MNPLIGAASQHQAVLLPDTAPGKVKARILECLTEVQPFGIRVPDIDAAVIGQVGMHTAIGGEQEVIKFLIAHVVVHDLPRRLLYVHVVGRIRQDQVGPIAIHQTGVNFFAGAVAADHPVLSDQPKVTQLAEDRLLQFGIHIEVVLVDLLVMELIEQRIDLRRIKAGLAQVKVAVLDIFQKFCQQGIVPGPGDLVQRDVQRLLPNLIDIHNGAGHFGIAKIDGYRQPLVTADDRHVGVHDQRVCKAELFDTVFDFLVLFIPDFQLFARIVFCRFEYRYRQNFQFSSLLHRSLHLFCQL